MMSEYLANKDLDLAMLDIAVKKQSQNEQTLWFYQNRVKNLKNCRKQTKKT